MRLEESGCCYAVAVKRDFVARHFLFGGDWGLENDIHSHHYQVELELQGRDLDQHGYLVDIVDIEKNLDFVVGSFRDKVLNELPEFQGLNPSIENLSRIMCTSLSALIDAPNIHALVVRIWENDIAWASFRWERS
ncbi:MAG: 6-pyruvoyltetrahydropterin/6-carboxytetrahydropterin synthase [Thermodesulfobacteriota bacterium]|nr:6-pyruvoyltetrahydropterin/6-carboxytetrahydropterin synthase [Thermodesulfobacteriota bacterium]